VQLNWNPLIENYEWQYQTHLQLNQQWYLDDQTFNLAEAGKAHDRLLSGQGMGKVIVDIK
jgi:hypothetical protein